MTYCLGMLLQEGLILMADTRTNAGVDNFSSFRKLHTLAEGPSRQIWACTAGSLSVTQAILATLAEGLPWPTDEGPEDGPPRTFETVPTMFQAAQLLSEATVQERGELKPILEADGVSSGVSLLLGGRIGNAPPSLYLVYAAGNFIENKPEAPFFQIGETKYGKPILDRVLTPATPIDEAVKLGALSFDAAMRSNLGVAPPIDIVILPTDRERPVIKRRIEEHDPWFDELSRRWHEDLAAAQHLLPNPPWLCGAD